MLNSNTAPVDIGPILNSIYAGNNKPTVNLSDLKISVEQLTQIAAAASSMGGYTTYKLSNCGLTPAHIDTLVRRGITTLIADNNPSLTALNADGVKRIAALRLTHCDLSYCDAGRALDAFANTPIQSLTVRGGGATGLTIAGATALMANTSLREINISGNRLNFDNKGCLIIAANNRLERVNLRGCNAMDDAVRLLSNNTNLITLDLSNCREITPAGVSLLGNMRITSLAMVGVYINAGPAARNPNLEVVDLNFNYNLGDAGFSEFAKLPNLRSINVFSCGLTDASVDLMLKMNKLVNVVIGENPISPAKLLQLQEHLKNNINRAAGVSASASLTVTQPADAHEVLPSLTVASIAKDSEQPPVKLSESQPTFWKQHQQNIIESAQARATYSPNQN